MLIIGLLILLAAAAFAGVVISENWGGGTFAVKGFGHVLGHLHAGADLHFRHRLDGDLLLRPVGRQRVDSAAPSRVEPASCGEPGRSRGARRTRGRARQVGARTAAAQRAAASRPPSSTLASAQPAYVRAGQAAYAPPRAPGELFPTPNPRPVVMDEGPLMHEVEV